MLFCSRLLLFCGGFVSGFGLLLLFCSCSRIGNGGAFFLFFFLRQLAGFLLFGFCFLGQFFGFAIRQRLFGFQLFFLLAFLLFFVPGLQFSVMFLLQLLRFQDFCFFLLLKQLALFFFFKGNVCIRQRWCDLDFRRFGYPWQWSGFRQRGRNGTRNRRWR